MAKIDLLIGMIASGKSTYARNRADAGALIVSHDDLTQMLHGRYRYEADLKPHYRSMMRELASCGLDAGRDVVIDRTHLDRDSRTFWVDFAKEWRVPIVAVVFPIASPHEHASRRIGAESRGRSYDDWLRAAQHHTRQASADPLDWAGEGFTSIIAIADGGIQIRQL